MLLRRTPDRIVSISRDTRRASYYFGNGVFVRTTERRTRRFPWPRWSHTAAEIHTSSLPHLPTGEEVTSDLDRAHAFSFEDARAFIDSTSTREKPPA